MTTAELENIPGFRDGIMVPEPMGNMSALAERFGAEDVRHRGGNLSPVDAEGHGLCVSGSGTCSEQVGGAVHVSRGGPSAQ